MKRKLAKNKGMILIIVISILSVISIDLIILGRCSSIILFQTDRAYLNAVNEDLSESAEVWLVENASDLRTGFTEELDVSKLNYKNASIDIAVEKIEKDSAFVRINTRCSRGRQNVAGSRIYRISLP